MLADGIFSFLILSSSPEEAPMNMWIVLLIGVIIGWIIGIIVIRQNFQTCKKQVDLLKQELMERDENLQKSTQTLEALAQEVEKKEEQLQSFPHP